MAPNACRHSLVKVKLMAMGKLNTGLNGRHAFQTGCINQGNSRCADALEHLCLVFLKTLNVYFKAK